MWSCGREFRSRRLGNETPSASPALGQYGGKVERDGRRWSVQLSASEGAALPNLLTALKQCLDENEIAAVKVELDGQAYAMEGLT